MTIILAYFIADFISGVVHWAQDKFLNEPYDTPLLEALRLENDLHHARPGAMLKLSPFENLCPSLHFAWLISILFLLADMPTLGIAFFFASFANLIHRFSHIVFWRLHPAVQWLQRMGVFISQDAHMKHHWNGFKFIEKKDTTGRYCVMSNLLNPILDGIGFFKFFERILLK